MSDLIKREDAIAKTFCTAVSGVPTMVVLLNDIKALPSIDSKTKVVAQVTFDEDKLREIVHEAVEQIKEEYDIVDRPKGEWFKDDEGTFICSACGSGYKDQPTLMGKPMFEWCPLCGARMKGADDEAD